MTPEQLIFLSMAATVVLAVWGADREIAAAFAEEESEHAE